jgi:hypothetical protein
MPQDPKPRQWRRLLGRRCAGGAGVMGGFGVDLLRLLVPEGCIVRVTLLVWCAGWLVRKMTSTLAWRGLCTNTLASRNQVCVAFYSLKSMNADVTSLLQKLLK